MKVNEIINEAGVWQGIKNVGRGLGQVAGGIGTGAISVLDRMAGGTGDVGTQAQRQARKREKTEKEYRKMLNEVPKAALAQFDTQMQNRGIDIRDPRSFNPAELGQMMQVFSASFFAAQERADVKHYITQSIPYEKLPTNYNPSTILDYFGEIEKIRQNGERWSTQHALDLAQRKEQEQRTQQTQAEPEKASAPAEPKLAAGVTVLSQEPMVLQVGKQRYYVADDGLWHEAGNRNPVDSTWNAFLNNQADLATPESQVTTTTQAVPTGPTRQQKQQQAAARARSQMGIK